MTASADKPVDDNVRPPAPSLFAPPADIPLAEFRLPLVESPETSIHDPSPLNVRGPADDVIGGLADPPPTGVDSDTDYRLYLPDTQAFSIDVKRTGDREYCFLKRPNEEFFHLLLEGELFIRRGSDMFCLDCAVRNHVLSNDRLFWKRGRHTPPTI